MGFFYTWGQWLFLTSGLDRQIWAFKGTMHEQLDGFCNWAKHSHCVSDINLNNYVQYMVKHNLYYLFLLLLSQDTCSGSDLEPFSGLYQETLNTIVWCQVTRSHITRYSCKSAICKSYVKLEIDCCYSWDKLLRDSYIISIKIYLVVDILIYYWGYVWPHRS
jgi:hypothetical protein